MMEFLKGLMSFYKAKKVISENGMWPFVLLPAIASAVVSPLIFYAFYVYFGRLARFVNDNWLPPYLQSDIAQSIMTMIFWLFGLILFLVSIRSIIMVIFSPILGFLSEKTEYALKGSTPPPFSMVQISKDIMRSLILNAIALAIFLVLFVFAWLLIFIPIAGSIISPLLILLIESYFAGSSFIDPSLERHRYNVRDSFVFAWNHKMRMIGLGTGFTLLMFIPLIGWFLAPPFGVVAATISHTELD